MDSFFTALFLKKTPPPKTRCKPHELNGLLSARVEAVAVILQTWLCSPLSAQSRVSSDSSSASSEEPALAM